MIHRARPPIWLWVNLLSFDAPFVALVWQSFFARCYGPLLSWPERCLLGLSVWAIYIADGLLDARCLPSARGCSRHEFYQRNRRPMSLLLACILLLDFGIALSSISPAVFRNGLIVVVAVMAYLCTFVWLRCGGRRLKQLVAAILFGMGVCVAGSTQTNLPFHALVCPGIAFCGLCYLNLLFIEKWEGIVLTRHTAVAMLFFAHPLAMLQHNHQWYAAIGAGVIGLAILDSAGERLSGDARRMLADVALLTPLFFR